MSWIKYVLSFLVFLLVLLVGLEFALINSDPVKVNYFTGSVQVPLSAVVVSAFAVGVVLCGLLSLVLAVLPLRWRAGRLQRLLTAAQSELATLRKQASQRSV